MRDNVSIKYSLEAEGANTSGDMDFASSTEQLIYNMIVESLTTEGDKEDSTAQKAIMQRTLLTNELALLGNHPLPSSSATTTTTPAAMATPGRGSGRNWGSGASSSSSTPPDETDLSAILAALREDSDTVQVGLEERRFELKRKQDLLDLEKEERLAAIRRADTQAAATKIQAEAFAMMMSFMQNQLADKK